MFKPFLKTGKLHKSRPHAIYFDRGPTKNKKKTQPWPQLPLVFDLFLTARLKLNLYQKGNPQKNMTWNEVPAGLTAHMHMLQQKDS